MRILCCAQVFRTDTFGRDVYLIPYYLAKELQAEAVVAYPHPNGSPALDCNVFARGGEIITYTCVKAYL